MKIEKTIRLGGEKKKIEFSDNDGNKVIYQNKQLFIETQSTEIELGRLETLELFKFMKANFESHLID